MALSTIGTDSLTALAVTPAKMSQKLTSGTAVASTSGTSIDFTGIPSWVKRITVMFNGVSTNGSSDNLVQIGSGSVETTGYSSSAGYSTSYATSSADMALTKKGGELIDQYYNAARKGDKKRVEELATLYADITGNSISDAQFENQIKEEFYSDIEKNKMGTKTPRQLLNAGRMSRILEGTR